MRDNTTALAVDLSIILPAYKEAANLQHLLPALEEAAAALTNAFEILVVDTATPMDETPALCDGCRTLYTPRGGGNDYGDAIRTGIAASRGAYVVTMDADCSHDPAFIGRMWKRRHDAELVIASRYVDGGHTDNPPVLEACSRILNWTFAFVLRLPVRDVSNSFRLYNGDVLRKLDLRAAHFDILEEILARLLWDPQRPVRVLELPFDFRRRRDGESKRSTVVFVAAYMRAMVRLWFLKRALRRGVS